MNNNDELRVIRPISKSEFSHKFMNMSPSTFRRNIHKGKIFDNLKKLKYRKHQKIIYPRQANYILSHFGITSDIEDET